MFRFWTSTLLPSLDVYWPSTTHLAGIQLRWPFRPSLSASHNAVSTMTALSSECDWMCIEIDPSPSVAGCSNDSLHHHLHCSCPTHISKSKFTFDHAMLQANRDWQPLPNPTSSCCSIAAASIPFHHAILLRCSSPSCSSSSSFAELPTWSHWLKLFLACSPGRSWSPWVQLECCDLACSRLPDLHQRSSLPLGNSTVAFIWEREKREPSWPN